MEAGEHYCGVHLFFGRGVQAQNRGRTSEGAALPPEEASVCSWKFSSKTVKTLLCN